MRKNIYDFDVPSIERATARCTGNSGSALQIQRKSVNSASWLAEIALYFVNPFPVQIQCYIVYT